MVSKIPKWQRDFDTNVALLDCERSYPDPDSIETFVEYLNNFVQRPGYAEAATTDKTPLPSAIQHVMVKDARGGLVLALSALRPDVITAGSLISYITSFGTRPFGTIQVDRDEIAVPTVINLTVHGGRFRRS